MDIFHCLLLVVPISGFSPQELNIIDSLVDYFQPSYLDLLFDVTTDDLPPFVAHPSYPSRHLRMTSVVNSHGLVKNLLREKTDRGGPSLVIVKDGLEAWSALSKVADSKLLQNAKWVVLTTSPIFKPVINNLTIPFDCQFLVVNMAGVIHIITEVYHIAEGEPIKTAHFGYWEPKVGLVPPTTNFYDRRPTLQGHTFNAIIKNIQPYTYVTNHKNGSTTLGGYFYEVWKELEFRLKFKTKFQIFNRGDKIWPELKKSNYSFCVSPIWQDSEIIMSIGLTEPIYEPKIHLFGRRPGSELEWNSYLKPFSTGTWLTMLGWLVGSAVALSILYYIAWRYDASERDAGYYAFPLSICLETTFRAAVGQGSDAVPHSLSCRVLFLSIYMTALVLMSAFSAALFSLLTVPVTKEPFTSFRQVYEANNFKLGIIPDSGVYEGIKDLAKRHPNADRSKLLRILEPAADMPGSVVQALDRICHRTDYIFMWDLPNVQLRIPELTRICQERIMSGGPMLFNEFLSFGTTRRSPYRGIINLHLIRMKNEGVLNRLLVNTWPARMPNVAGSWVRVTLGDISPILYMFSLGVVLGVILLIFERVHFPSNKKLSERSSQSENSMKDALRKVRERYPDGPITPTEPLYSSWKNNDLHYRYRYKSQYKDTSM